MKRIFVLNLFLLLVASSLFSQEIRIKYECPELKQDGKVDVFKGEGGELAIAHDYHPEDQSRIEIMFIFIEGELVKAEKIRTVRTREPLCEGEEVTVYNIVDEDYDFENGKCIAIYTDVKRQFDGSCDLEETEESTYLEDPEKCEEPSQEMLRIMGGTAILQGL